VAIVSGGGKQRIEFHIDAGGIHDLTIWAKNGPSGAGLLQKGLLGLSW
jgi:hypothetical protein